MKRIAAIIIAMCIAVLMSSCFSPRYECPACGRKTDKLYECPVCYTKVCEYCADADHFIENIYDDKEAIMDYVIGMGWAAEWAEEQYGKEAFRDGFLAGYDEGYETGYQDGKKN